MSIRDLGIPTPKVLQDCYFNRVFIGSTGATGSFVITDKIQVNSTNGSNFGYMQDTPDGQLKLQAGGPSPSITLNPDGGQMMLGTTGAFGPQYNLNVRGNVAIDNALYVGVTGTAGQMWLSGNTGHGFYRTPATNDLNIKTTGGALYLDSIGNGNNNFRINQNLQSGSRPLFMNNPTPGLGCYADFNDATVRFVAGVGGSNGNGIANSAFLGTYSDSDVYVYRNSIQTAKINSANDVEFSNGLRIGNSASTVPGTITYGSNVVNIQNAGGKYSLTNPLNMNNNSGTQLKMCLQSILLVRSGGNFVLGAANTNMGFGVPTITSQSPLIINVTVSDITNVYNKSAFMAYTNANNTESFAPFFTSDGLPTFEMRTTRSSTGAAISNTDFADGGTLLYYVQIIGN